MKAVSSIRQFLESKMVPVIASFLAAQCASPLALWVVDGISGGGEKTFPPAVESPDVVQRMECGREHSEPPH
jgi:hypothetical protein